MIERKVYKTMMAGGLAATVFLCSACGNAPQDKQVSEEPEAEQPQEKETIQVTIPGSLFRFSNTDIEENMEELADYCVDVKQEGEDLLLEMTEEQKADLIALNQENMDDILDEVKEANPEYSCELSSDHSSVVYKYDEKIDGILQGKILLSLTTIYAFNGIIETNNADWSVTVSVVNCHTGKTVAQVVLPEETVSFGESEWAASYE